MRYQMQFKQRTNVHYASTYTCKCGHKQQNQNEPCLKILRQWLNEKYNAIKQKRITRKSVGIFYTLK